MLKKLHKKQLSLILGAGITAFLAGGMVFAPQIGKSVEQWLKQFQNEPEQLSEATKAKSLVLPLVLESPSERAAKLEALTKESQSQDRNRARYLLASDLIEREDGKSALKLLEGLEKDYPLLAPYILLKQAQAQNLLGEEGKASDLRQAVVKRYPEHPAAAKALYLIGLPEYQERAIAKFPSHPLTWEIIKKRLADNPNQPQLQLILAKYSYDQPGITFVLDSLAKSSTLQAEDWETIAGAYWENKEFGKAAVSYGKAPRTPRNIYRMGRGLQISGKTDAAKTAFNQLVSAFPESEEAGLATLRLSELAKTSKETLPYLDKIISKYPAHGGEAIIRKAKILEAQGNKKAAASALQLLISKFDTTEEAAEYRWKVAEAKAKAKDYQAAWQWAEPIANKNPDSILAPRAAFWVGKWATKLGKRQEAKQAYEFVISQFPYSYYAWRSAAILQLNVGNFNTLRQLKPEIVPLMRPVPTAGSETFKELYLLGQDRDAWLQWQTEFTNKMQPTVPEQFTEGLVQLTRGENLLGIDKISKLEDREKPEDRAEYDKLNKQLIYWQARYPFPYLKEIKKWSGERQLNPLLVTALIRQESRFEKEIISSAGATGLMQVMPDTAKWIAPQIKADYKNLDLKKPQDNIMLGTWYLDHTHEQYGNNSLLAIASYNAGPGNVSKWLKSLPKDDPDDFVEAIPFDETKNYVRQVLGNYWNYLRLYNPEISRIVGEYSASHPKLPHEGK
ncbi:transglycosylase SLT domain-containing protein [Calothrix sp. 336/3]|uniref:transglycosylase SLT domain-containing protein n=1 Tax=Calothrix sp. 336/3 TaxID=1337936 RepID=UPI0004E3DE49|nr:transglycosylase SLT domain-containing protein [Calothrix sp. 336/3]AKG22384.1 tail length tape measure protein [Calothrix sp. 336/3]